MCVRRTRAGRAGMAAHTAVLHPISPVCWRGAHLIAANAVIAVRVGNRAEDPTPAPSGAQPEAVIMTGTAVVVTAVNSLA